MKIKDIENRYNKKHCMMKDLHDAFGIDWTKPYVEIEHNGKFTIHSFEKDLENIGFTNKDSILLAIVKGHELWDKDYWYVIKVCNCDFTINLPYILDTYCRKCDFNDARKKETCMAIFFAQKKEYLTNHSYVHCTYGGYEYKNKPIDICSRFTNPRETKIYNAVLDKSGYCLTHYRNDLNQKVAVYKADKAKREYLKTDNTDKIKTLERLIETYKKKLADDVLSISTTDDVRQIDGLLSWGGLYDIIHTFGIFKEKTLDKTYDSIAQSDKDYDCVAKKCYAYIG